MRPRSEREEDPGPLGRVLRNIADQAAEPEPTGPRGASAEPTPYAVKCREHGIVYLTEREYYVQLCAADSLWLCPHCGESAAFQDDIFEAAINKEEG